MPLGQPLKSLIDTSTVKVGASATVVYGLGYRDPVSGEWAKLDTAAGVIQAVNPQRLLLTLQGERRPQRIDSKRIQTLLLAKPPPHRATAFDSTKLDADRDTSTVEVGTLVIPEQAWRPKTLESGSEKADQPGQISATEYPDRR